MVVPVCKSAVEISALNLLQDYDVASYDSHVSEVMDMSNRPRECVCRDR